MAFTHHLVIYRGATLRRRFQWKSGGQPVDLTGWKARAEGRASPDDAEPAFALSTDDGTITLDAEGWIELHLDQTATADIELEVGLWDCSLQSPDGDVHPPLIVGKAQTKQMVTRWPTI